MMETASQSMQEPCKPNWRGVNHGSGVWVAGAVIIIITITIIVITIILTITITITAVAAAAAAASLMSPWRIAGTRVCMKCSALLTP